jgi:NAD(P)-dependent dehydrogenase (short-subunit alcohol dehydrogenase family)
LTTVFITGASSGIGAALARHYASLGAHLGLTGRNAERLAALLTELPPGCATSYLLDVRDAAALQHAAQDFTLRFGAPDIVIANAGISYGTLAEEAGDTPAFQAIMDTNLLGMVHTFQPFIRPMKEQGGSLVGIASVAGLRGLPGAGAYSASKAAVIAYLESLRVELARSAIHVTTICPGYIRTPMTDVNTHPMPFMLEVEVAAEKIAKIIECKHRYIILPWQMALLGRVIQLLPVPIWDWLAQRAPRKPRLK